MLVRDGLCDRPVTPAYCADIAWFHWRAPNLSRPLDTPLSEALQKTIEANIDELLVDDNQRIVADLNCYELISGICHKPS